MAASVMWPGDVRKGHGIKTRKIIESNESRHVVIMSSFIKILMSGILVSCPIAVTKYHNKSNVAKKGFLELTLSGDSPSFQGNHREKNSR